MEIADFSSPETDSGRAWLQPIGQEYEVEEVHILRNAHLALHPNITRFVFIFFLPCRSHLTNFWHLYDMSR